jgi:hypothetical protein
MIKKMLLFTMGLALSGCLVTVDSHSRAVNTAWSDNQVANLQVGKSDQQMVKKFFGDPFTRLTNADGTEIWKYRNIYKKDTEFGLFLLLSVDSKNERVETLSIEFADGIVNSYWTEGLRY